MKPGRHCPLYIRPRQVPEFFGISERTVRHLMMRGDLKENLHWFKKSSRMVLLSVQALEEWIKEG
ncbi:MAG: helix-turn-helix domain-containing protein [Deltaproteobacteria bacterium]|nr:helix-turn-helix domain-containing protein [Deltaproteobacteria bacterium]